jgi:hypothetical protein
LWQEYRWTILGTLFIFALQAAMIAGLLLQRMRRRWSFSGNAKSSRMSRGFLLSANWLRLSPTN